MTDDRAELERVHTQWDRLAQEDPLWAVLTDPAKEHGKWDTEDFFRTGEHEVEIVMDRLLDVDCVPDLAGEALDFGCGVGRLTAALASRFAAVHGVDISAKMIDQARALTSGPTYHHNMSADLRLFDDGRFAFIYSSITLQHCPVPAAKAYIGEFLRILAPGGICVMQIPEHRRPDPANLVLRRYVHAVRASLAIRTRLRQLVGGESPPRRSVATERMDMNTIPQREVERIVQESGGEVVDMIWTNSAAFAFNGDLQYSEQPSGHGWASRQYAVRRARTGTV